MCEYYLGEKQNALEDFYRHREIINRYIQDQQESEYKAVYPTYTQNNLVNIEAWIKAALAL